MRKIAGKVKRPAVHGTPHDDDAGTIGPLLADPGIVAARRHVEASDGATVARQVAISRIPAPTGGEERRATRIADLFRDAGLQHVGIDGVGNALGWYGTGDTGTGDGCVVLSAHLDTVFGPEVDVTVRHDGGRLVGPGVSDNARGLTAVMQYPGR